MMFRDVASTKEAWHIATTVALGATIAAWWWLDLSRWAVGLLGVSFVLCLTRCFLPASYELVVDQSGVAWGRIGKKKSHVFLWPDVSVVRHIDVEREIHIGRRGSSFLAIIPTYFLRSDSKRAEFLAAVTTFSPSTKIDHA
jgi:hypothetical protein